MLIFNLADVLFGQCLQLVFDKLCDFLCICSEVQVSGGVGLDCRGGCSVISNDVLDFLGL